MGDTTNKKCLDCGKRIRVGPRSKHTKYCQACVKRRDLENKHKQKEKLKQARREVPNRTRPCSQCGTDFVRPAGLRGGARTRCDACRATPVSRRTLPENRPCEDCGDTIQLKPGANQRFCQACRMERTRIQDRERKEQARPSIVRTLTCQRCGKAFQKNQRGRDPRACLDCRVDDYESRRPPRSTTTADRYRWRLARQYGMTVEQRDAMAERQGHKCLLCGTPESNKRLHVDHDHTCCPTSGMSCGKCVRGLICRRCNNTLGLVDDQLDILQKMLNYLKAGGAPRSPNRARLRS